MACTILGRLAWTDLTSVLRCVTVLGMANRPADATQLETINRVRADAAQTIRDRPCDTPEKLRRHAAAFTTPCYLYNVLYAELIRGEARRREATRTSLAAGIGELDWTPAALEANAEAWERLREFDGQERARQYRARAAELRLVEAAEREAAELLASSNMPSLSPSSLRTAADNFEQWGSPRGRTIAKCYRAEAERRAAQAELQRVQEMGLKIANLSKQRDEARTEINRLIREKHAAVQETRRMRTDAARQWAEGETTGLTIYEIDQMINRLWGRGGEESRARIDALREIRFARATR